MRVRWPVLAAVLSVCSIYVAYPYVTLLRLGMAVQSADAATLESLVDWPAVREGIKEDVCDLGGAGDASKSGNLPPFGASFVRGIASSTIDQTVTPEALVSGAATTSGNQPPRAQKSGSMHIDWAFFQDPTTFIVSFRTTTADEPIRMEMDLRDGQWLVRRVWLPETWLSGSQHHA